VSWARRAGAVLLVLACQPARAQDESLQAKAARMDAELSMLEASHSQFDPAVVAAASAYVPVLLAVDEPFANWQSHPSLYWLITRALAPMPTGDTLGEADWLAASALIAENLGALEQAEVRWRRVLQMRSKLLPAGDASVVATRARLAGTLADLGRVDEAEGLANDALGGFDAKAPERAIALIALGKVQALRGRPEVAEPLFQRAIAAREQVFGAQHPLLADARFELARFLRAQQRDAEADAILQPLLVQVIATAKGGPRMQRLLLEMVDGLRDAEQCRQAGVQLDALRGAYTLQLETTAKQRMRFWESRGRLYACAGDSVAAAKQFEEAFNEFLRAQTVQDSAEFGLANARYALWLAGHPEVADAAGRYARQAVGIANSRRRQGFANSDAPSFGNAVDRAVHTLGGGSPLALAYEADLAVDWPAHAQGQTWAIAQGFVSAQELALSGAAVAMAQTRARTAAGSDALAQTAARQQQLSAQAVALDRERLAARAGGEDAKAAQLQARLQALGTELEALDARLSKEFPQYAQLVSPQALPLRELQARLGADEGLLLLVPVRGDVHAFAISRSAARWHRLTGGAAVTAARVARLRCQVDPATCGQAGASDSRGVQSVFGAATAQGGRAFDRDAAYGLYHELVEPVEPALAGVKRLYVASAGALGQLPLGLLVTRAPVAGEDDADPAVLAASDWFADRYALLALPAVSALRAEPAPAPKASANAGFVGFGAPVLRGAAGGGRSAVSSKLFARANAQGQALADVAALRQLAPLPGTQVELQAMAAQYAGQATLALGAEATEARLKALPQLSRARVIAFATHGLLPRELRGMDEPGLVFTPPAQASALDDGVLTASEAAGLSLAADWIILSACNTAAGAGASGGESLSGLGRAFLYAGARALLASHWRVSDDATAALTTETLGAWHGEGRAQALQAAMRAVRTGKRADGSPVPGWKPAWAHPAAWAPFVLIAAGDG
jgi:CHAT domain-containing protein